MAEIANRAHFAGKAKMNSAYINNVIFNMLVLRNATL